jgi:site-specific DNA recombinase
MTVRAGVYVRISLDREGRRAGVERQRADCLALCERKGWHVASEHIYEDNDKSAFDGAVRPNYDRLCGDVTDGSLDVVVAYAQDRLWRDVVEQQLFLADGRKAGLKLVATPTGEFDPADADGEFVSTVLAAASRKASQDTRRRMKRKQLEKAQRGEAHGGRRGFGHTQDRMKTVPAEAKLIREAARRMLRGESMRSVVMDWRSKNIRTATGVDWTVPSLADLMRQPRLMGLREHHGTLYDTKWAVLLDRDTWERVQAIAAARKMPGKRAVRKHILTGILRCSKCGAPMRGGRKDGAPRYLCTAPGIHKEGCGGTVILGEAADDVVRDLVLEYIDTPQLAKALERLGKSSTDGDIGRLVESLEKDRAKLAELGDAYADNELDRAEYQRLTERVKQRVEANEKKLTNVASVPQLEFLGQGAKLRKAWDHLSLDERRDVLTSVLDHVVVLPAERPVNRFQPGRLRPVFRF